MQISSKTDKGLKRLSNQDSFIAEKLNDTCAFAIVCDGMGGANAGNVASETATKIISSYIKRSFNKKMNSNSIALMLQSAVKSANIEIYDMAKKNPSLDGMGTTVVAAVIVDDKAIICNVGDSRAYLISKVITQITRDHSIVQSLVESGKLTPQEAKVHPNKNVITRAIGVEEVISSDFYEISISEGNTILLCTDGLTNFVETSQILKAFKENNPQVTETLVDMANKNGGGDNITAVAITL